MALIANFRGLGMPQCGSVKTWFLARTGSSSTISAIITKLLDFNCVATFNYFRHSEIANVAFNPKA